jgi:methyl-accepting chemotaxis protein
MTWLSNITVKAKAIGAFALVLLSTAGLGVFSIDRLTTINHAADEIRDNWLPSVGLIGDIHASAAFYRIRESAHILSDTPEEKAEEQKVIANALKVMTTQRQRYEPLLTVGAETETYHKFSRSWDRYIAISEQKLLPLSRENRHSAASSLFRGESRAAFLQAEALLQELVTFNANGGKDAADLGEATYVSGRLWIAIAIALVVCICALAGWVIVATVSRPIQTLTGIMERLAGRDLAVVVTGSERKDEVGAMARAVEVFKAGLIDADRLAVAQSAEQGAIRQRANTMDRLIRGFEEVATVTLRAVSSAATELDATAQSMTAMAHQTNDQASTVATAAEQTSANVQTVATASEEMASSVHEIGEQVARSVRIASAAVEEAGRTNVIVRGLADAAQKIGDVVGLITNIASQTNLLALNATIEAARAGEAGKGFAVVASEVKSLANQTGQATMDIAAQIGAIQEATAGAVKAITGIGGTITQINEISTAIAAAIEEQGAATNEISRSVQQAAIGTQEVSSNIAQVTRTAGETGGAAGQVLSAAGELAKQAETLRSGVEEFLNSIKAA